MSNFLEYNGLTFTLLLLSVALSVAPALGGKFASKIPKSSFLFVCILALFVIWGRWQITTSALATDWDEAQFIVSAWAAAEDPVFFKVTDCGSSGPLNIWPLLWSYLAGEAPSQFSSRLLASLFMAGIAVLVFATAQFLIGHQSLARAAAIPVAAVFALNRAATFGQYNSEIPSLFYIMLGLASAAYILTKCPVRWVWLAASLGGAALSMCVLAKLQSVPMALVSGCAVLAATFYRMRGMNSVPLYATILLASSAIPVLFGGFMLWGGEWEYFWQAYVLSAISYRNVPGEATGAMWGILWRDKILCFYVVGATIFALSSGAICAIKKTANRRDWVIFLFGVGFCVVGLWTSISPNKIYAHYLLYLVVPFAILSIAALALHSGSVANRLWMFFVLALIPILVGFRDVRWAQERLPRTEAAQKILSVILAGAPSNDDKISVWGYAPDIYLVAGRKSGTRIATTAFFFLDIPGRDIYLDRYISDLLEHKPKVFLDISPVQSKERNFRYLRSFKDIPEVARVISENYTYSGTYSGADIYLLKEGEGQ